MNKKQKTREYFMGLCQFEVDEVITIKKKLWDEMLAYKHRIDELEENEVYLKHVETKLEKVNSNLSSRIDQLEFSLKILKRSAHNAYDELLRLIKNTKLNIGHAKECPICHGTGQIIHGLTSKSDICSVCLGKGCFTV